MKISFVMLIVLSASLSATAANKKDYWLNVESQKQEKPKKNNKPYPYDSLESPTPKQHFPDAGLWSLEPKLVLGGGFYGDKAFFENSQTNRLFVRAGLQFRQRPWHRISANTRLIQNNSFLVSGSWEYTPSRKSVRAYYGVGLAHLMIAEKEFGNLVEIENYFVTAHAGIEYLLVSRRGWSAEIKAYGGTSSYALEVSLAYIIPL